MADSSPNPNFQRSPSPPIPNTNPLAPAPSEPAPSASYQHPRVADRAPGGQLKRKRGRPRKYNPGDFPATLVPIQEDTIHPTTEQLSLPLALLPPAPPHSAPASSPTGRPASPSSSSMKKGRGRGRGSGLKKQGVEVLGSSGTGFTPHIIIVPAGEDVAARIMPLSQQGPGTISILSATGAVSNVTLRPASTSVGAASYQGEFDILSLSFLGDQRRRNGGLNITFVGPAGNVIGGCVARPLTAATPVQVILGRFMEDGRPKEPPPSKVPGGRGRGTL